MRRRRVLSRWLSGWLALAVVIPATGEWQTSRDNAPTTLEAALVRYEVMAHQGVWPLLPAGLRLEPGARDSLVPTLRARLEGEGYATGRSGTDAGYYDDSLAAALRRFQALHGLEEDGILGPATRGALNVPAEVRVHQIKSNLERRKELHDSLGDRYIIVNSAAFTLDLVDHGQSVLHLRAIVGRRDWPTPTVSSRITSVTFRPLWRVPRSILIDEVLPLIRRDSTYFRRTGMRIFRDSADGTEVDPAGIDWTARSGELERLRFVQEPGPANPLGGVKFVFWTPFGVYLHDTPAQRLFARRARTFSHGCVRVEQVEDLVAVVLPEWSMDSIRAAMGTGREREVPLVVPIPVHLVYWTAWAEDEGPLAFREDVYRLDH